MTQFVFRLLMLVPVVRIATFNAWVKSSGLDSEGGNWVTANLSPTGTVPATHGWFNACLNAQQLKKIMVRLCNISGVAQPEDWDTKTVPQKIQWFNDQKAAIRTATGIRYRIFRNDGNWDSADEALTETGLKRVTVSL